MSQEQKLGPENYDGRREYVHPASAPKPPPELWAELEAAGAAAGTGFETDACYLIARAKYVTWLHEQDIEGHPDPLHGHAPTEIDDDEDGIF